MILIAFDEYGNFEDKVSMPVFIAGFIYDDNGDPQDMEEEKKRISDYYNRVIQAAGNRYRKDVKENGEQPSEDILKRFSYPSALHCGRNEDDQQDRVVSYVKDEVCMTLGDFISTCRFNGTEISVNSSSDEKKVGRKGCYHLFVILKGKDGIRKSSENTDNMINDDYASNLYFHMAGRMVSRLLFHNPLYSEMPSVRVNVATRASYNFLNDKKELDEQYRSLGYEEKKSTDKKRHYYSLMNADVYRTLIAQEMLRCSSKISVESFTARSISYTKGNTDPFLLLADSICSYIGFKLKSFDRTFIREVSDKVNTINPYRSNLVFAYDEIDTLFGHAWEKYEEGELYQALSMVYDAKQSPSAYASFYNERLFAILEKQVINSSDPFSFARAVDDMSASVSSNNLDQEKLKYIFNCLKKMAENGKPLFRARDKKEQVLFRLWEAGMSASCHIGDPSAAIGYYNRCVPYFGNAGIDSVMQLNNRLIVAFEDIFALEYALEYAGMNLNYQKRLREIMNDLTSGVEVSGTISYGKTLSQYARILATNRDGRAEDYFRQALGQFGRDTADYKITQSYLLHFYLDQDMMEKYEAEATDYFDGRNNNLERLRYIVGSLKDKTSLFSTDYAMFVLFKGIYRTCVKDRNALDEDLWREIKDIGFSPVERISSQVFITRRHPWEIIYKYLRFFAFIKGDSIQEKTYAKNLKDCLKNSGPTIEALMIFGEAEYNYVKGDILRRDVLTEELSDYLKCSFSHFKEKNFSQEGDRRFMEMSNVFSYMYS